jgi:hypothetical protein
MSRPGPDGSAPDQRLRDAVRAPASLKFIEAWLRWRGEGRLLPPRSAMEIADIREMLETVLLFEINGPDDILIKVAGSRLRNYADFEATGRSLKDVTPPAIWPVRRYRMQAVASWPCAGIATTLDRKSIGAGVNVEGVTLPLEADEPGGSRLLITCLTALSGAVDPPVPGRRPLTVLPDEFAFIDIGAGCPERTGV